MGELMVLWRRNSFRFRFGCRTGPGSRSRSSYSYSHRGMLMFMSRLSLGASYCYGFSSGCRLDGDSFFSSDGFLCVAFSSGGDGSGGSSSSVGVGVGFVFLHGGDSLSQGRVGG